MFLLIMNQSIDIHTYTYSKYGPKNREYCIFLLYYLVIYTFIIVDIEYFPESWSEGYVIPLLKKGSINNENNYRGITLLCTLGQLFTRVLNNRLMDWADKYSVYIEAQIWEQLTMFSFYKE